MLAARVVWEAMGIDEQLEVIVNVSCLCTHFGFFPTYKCLNHLLTHDPRQSVNLGYICWYLPFDVRRSSYLIISNHFNLSFILLIHTVSSWVFHPHLVCVVLSIVTLTPNSTHSSWTLFMYLYIRHTLSLPHFSVSSPVEVSIIPSLLPYLSLNSTYSRSACVYSLSYHSSPCAPLSGTVII